MLGVNTNSSKGLNRKFIIAVIVIGLSYALIVAVLGLLVGQSAASVASVALTALATTVFKKFEDLRFKKTATTTIEIATLGIWAVLLLFFSFFGCQLVMGQIVSLVLTAVGFKPDLTGSLSDFIDFFSIPSVLIIYFLATSFAYFSAAYCAARVITQLRYSQVLIVGLLVLIFNAFILILQTALHLTSIEEIILFWSDSYSTGILWIVYLASALFGAWLAARHSGGRLQEVDG